MYANTAMAERTALIAEQIFLRRIMQIYVEVVWKHKLDQPKGITLAWLLFHHEGEIILRKLGEINSGAVKCLTSALVGLIIAPVRGAGVYSSHMDNSAPHAEHLEELLYDATSR